MAHTKHIASSETMDLELLKHILSSAANYTELKKLIVNAPFSQPIAAAYLFLGFVVLMKVNKKTQLIDRVALSDTELANNTTVVSVIPFKDIKIPVGHSENILAKAIDTGRPYDTTDWYYTFTPALTGSEARINQASAGIAYTVVYPLSIKDGGVLSFSYYQYEHQITDKQYDFMRAYSEIVSEAINKKLRS